jgi:hypothetical protein
MLTVNSRSKLNKSGYLLKLQHEETLYENGVLSSAKELTVVHTGIVTSNNISIWGKVIYCFDSEHVYWNV